MSEGNEYDGVLFKNGGGDTCVILHPQTFGLEFREVHGDPTNYVLVWNITEKFFTKVPLAGVGNCFSSGRWTKLFNLVEVMKEVGLS